MIQLSEDQHKVVKAIVEWYGQPHQQEFYLAGYAGTGKSTLVEVAIQEIQARYRIQTVRTAAYTGKAAFVLRRKGNAGASTVHALIYRLIEDDSGQPRFEIDRMGPAADADLIVLDECSMVDNPTAADIRSFHKKILVIGDPGQLPPVSGTGAFVNRDPDAFLQEIHRQAADSPILRLATMARQGQLPPIGDYGDGVRVVQYNRDAGQYVYDDKTQVICGLNKVRWALTQRMRRRAGFGGCLPLPGEPILCCRNNKDIGIFNGQQGSALNVEPGRIHPDHIEMTVDMEDAGRRELVSHNYLFGFHFDGSGPKPKINKGVCEFDWGYVLTCHKAQGSQWPITTVIDDGASFRENRWKWLYTALTRAESGMTVIVRGPQ